MAAVAAGVPAAVEAMVKPGGALNYSWQMVRSPVWNHQFENTTSPVKLVISPVLTGDVHFRTVTGDPRLSTAADAPPAAFRIPEKLYVEGFSPIVALSE